MINIMKLTSNSNDKISFKIFKKIPWEKNIQGGWNISKNLNKTKKNMFLY